MENKFQMCCEQP